jgi:hypothetical protein
MKTWSLLALSVVVLTVIVMPAAAPCHTLNPYLPWNDPAAEPVPPYNFDQVFPQISRCFYLPCPAYGAFADQFPDLPPVWQQVAGPFGFPVPVP